MFYVFEVAVSLHRYQFFSNVLPFRFHLALESLSDRVESLAEDWEILDKDPHIC